MSYVFEIGVCNDSTDSPTLNCNNMMNLSLNLYCYSGIKKKVSSSANRSSILSDDPLYPEMTSTM